MRRGRVLRSGEESGFSMTEVMATIAILGILVLSMSVALGNGFKFLLASKQRAAATQIANEQLERARAIAQSDWTQLGLVSSDLAGDPSIVAGLCGSSSAGMFASEPVMTAGTSASNPLYPHVKTINVGATVVTAKIYVTGVVNGGGCSVSNPSFKRVTVIASWAKGTPGVSSTVRLATLISPVERPTNPDFQGAASYSGGSLVGQATTLVAATQNTAIFPPQSTADGRSVGLVTTYKGAAMSPLGQVDGVVTTTQSTSSTSVDDDTLTALIDKHACAPAICGAAPIATAPNCETFNGIESSSHYLGGLLGQSMAATGSSCSTVANATDSLPYTKNTAAMTTSHNLHSEIPAGGAIPLTQVDLFNIGAWSTTSIVDRNLIGVQNRIVSTATAVLPTTKMHSFAIPGLFNVPNGVVWVDGGTFVASAGAGPGATAPSATGALTVGIYDPGSGIAGCSSRSVDYCVFSLNPSGAGFLGLDREFTIVQEAPSLLPAARITITTTLKVFSPSQTSTSSGGAITQATMTYSLPKITSKLVVESPVGTQLALFEDSIDFGQLVTSAFYTPAS